MGGGPGSRRSNPTIGSATSEGVETGTKHTPPSLATRGRTENTYTTGPLKKNRVRKKQRMKLYHSLLVIEIIAAKTTPLECQVNSLELGAQKKSKGADTVRVVAGAGGRGAKH